MHLASANFPRQNGVVFEFLDVILVMQHLTCTCNSDGGAGDMSSIPGQHDAVPRLDVVSS